MAVKMSIVVLEAIRSSGIAFNHLQDVTASQPRRPQSTVEMLD
jgi:hypothetical protein